MPPLFTQTAPACPCRLAYEILHLFPNSIQFIFIFLFHAVCSITVGGTHWKTLLVGKRWDRDKHASHLGAWSPLSSSNYPTFRAAPSAVHSSCCPIPASTAYKSSPTATYASASLYLLPPYARSIILDHGIFIIISGLFDRSVIRSVIRSVVE